MRKSAALITLVILVAAVSGLAASIVQPPFPYTATSTLTTYRVVISNETRTTGFVSTVTAASQTFEVTYHSLIISKVTRTSTYASLATSTASGTDQALAWAIPLALAVVALLAALILAKGRGPKPPPA